MNRLRVLIANERRDRLALVAPLVTALGHEVIALEVDGDTAAGIGDVLDANRPGSPTEIAEALVVRPGNADLECRYGRRDRREAAD